MKTMRKITAYGLLLCTLFVCSAGFCRTILAKEMYNNISYANVDCGINSSGLLEAALYAVGITGITRRIKVELYVEKRVLGIFWKRMDIGCTNNVWEDYTTNIVYSNTFSTNLSSTGTYRVTVKFTAYGTGGTEDEITIRKQLTY